jgi:hypothetical protein
MFENTKKKYVIGFKILDLQNFTSCLLDTDLSNCVVVVVCELHFGTLLPSFCPFCYPLSTACFQHFTRSTFHFPTLWCRVEVVLMSEITFFQHADSVYWGTKPCLGLLVTAAYVEKHFGNVLENYFTETYFHDVDFALEH